MQNTKNNFWNYFIKKNRPVESIIKAIVVCKYPYGFKEIIPMKDAF